MNPIPVPDDPIQVIKDIIAAYDQPSVKKSVHHFATMSEKGKISHAISQARRFVRAKEGK